MEAVDRIDETRDRQGYIGLIGLVSGLALGAVALHAVAGPPRLPAELPGWEVVASTLSGAYLPLETLACVLLAAAWAVWFWIVASFALRLFVVGIEAVTRGSVRCGPLRDFSDLVTLPIVRRLVDGALVAIVVANLVGRTASTAVAAPASTPVLASASSPERDPRQPRWAVKDYLETGGIMEYTVRPGDTLWAIAERVYGTGQEFPRLVAANAGRQMADGRQFSQAGVIHPGWVLHIPLPEGEAEEGERRAHYVVEAGDSLRAIASRLLRDESRWSEIFEINRGRAMLDDGRVLRDPGLIWPGLRLELPIPATCEPPEPVTETGGERSGDDPSGVLEDPAAGSLAAGLDADRGGGVVASMAEPPVVIQPAEDSEPERAPTGQNTSPVPYAAGVLIAAATASGGILLTRRRARRRLSDPPVRLEEVVRTDGDFAEVEFGRSFAHRLCGENVEPTSVSAEQALRFLDEQQLRRVSLITALQRRCGVALVLSAGLADQARIVDLACELGTRLGGTGRASLTADRDVELELCGTRLAGLATGTGRGLANPPCLLPFGVLPKGERFYANWRELGHVLMAGIHGCGSEVVLASILSGLCARSHPAELHLLAIADRHALPSHLHLLPHLRARCVDPCNEEGVSAILRQARSELVHRIQETERKRESDPDSTEEQPDLLVVVTELAGLKDDWSTLELIGVHGPDHGVRVLAVTSSPERIGDELLAHFRTRIALGPLDEESSIRLLGEPLPPDLPRGSLLLRIDGRVPVRMRGFRVSEERLEELVRAMQDAYGGRVPEATFSAAERQVPIPDKPPAPQSLETYEINEADGMEDHQVGSAALASRADTGSPARVEAHGGSEESEQPTNGSEETLQSSDIVAAAKGAVGAAMQQEATDPVSLLQVKCFGGFAVKSGDREITPSLEEGASFKGWEVLAFLAAQPDGAAPKEKLLAALWPEVDTERASNRMRVAMVRLRTLLARQVPEFASEAVRCERDGTCRIDTALISSDVHRFMALCRSASKLPYEQARAALEEGCSLYDGDLLSGPGASHYAWADERSDNGLSLRESYREEYYRATQRLARLHSREGRPDLAVPLYKRLLKAEPTLEDIVRELYRCYQQLGDLSSLIREDRHFRQMLREAYYDPDDPEDDPGSYQPEPETIELFTSIRAELEARTNRGGVVGVRVAARA